MAHKLNLAFPIQGINYLWNIDAKVGTETAEPNLSDDVALVQILFILSLKSGNGSFLAPGCRNPPTVTSSMNQATGFWIYAAQVESGAKADGHLTPSTKSPTNERLIVRLNTMAAEYSRAEWENLPHLPICPASLKAKLLAPAR